MADKDVDAITGTETTGHEWDGIKELNTPLPRWWLWTFYATIIWGHWLLYPLSGRGLGSAATPWARLAILPAPNSPKPWRPSMKAGSAGSTSSSSSS